MNKVIKWTLYGFAVVLAAVAVICYFAFPNESRAVIDRVMAYANTPVGIAGVSTTIGGVLLFVISKYVIGNTKFGRKELDSMKDAIEVFKVEANSSIIDYKKRFESLKGEYESKFLDLKKESEGKIAIVYNEFTDLQATMLESLKSFPNKRIQELVARYEGAFSEREKEITAKVTDAYGFIDKKFAEIDELFKEKYSELCDKVEKTLNEKAEND